MINHVFLGTNDVEKSRTFYNSTMQALGYGAGHDLPHGTAFANGEGAIVVAKPANGETASTSNGGTLGLKAASYDAVEAWHSAGIANGGTDEGAPGFRENSPGNMYGAYLRDPDGHKICAFAPNTGPKE